MLASVRRFFLRRAIKRGANLLDREGPVGWTRAIDTQRLDIFSGRDCVLGQLYGTYGMGKHVLNIEGFTAAKYGFSLPALGNDWDELNEEWRKFLAEREAEELVNR